MVGRHHVRRTVVVQVMSQKHTYVRSKVRVYVHPRVASIHTYTFTLSVLLLLLLLVQERRAISSITMSRLGALVGLASVLGVGAAPHLRNELNSALEGARRAIRTPDAKKDRILKLVSQNCIVLLYSIVHSMYNHSLLLLCIAWIEL